MVFANLKRVIQCACFKSPGSRKRALKCNLHVLAVTQHLLRKCRLVSSSSLHRGQGLQTGSTDVQVAIRLCTVISLRQVGARGQSPSLLVWCHHMRQTVVQNSSGQQVVWYRWTAALEQAACFIAVIWQSLPFRRQLKTFLFVKDQAMAPSDSCF